MIKVKKVVKKKGSEGGTETTTTSEEVTTVTETTNTKSQNGYENGKRSVQWWFTRHLSVLSCVEF